MSTWDLSCPDWWQRLQAGQLPMPTLPLTPHGDRAVAVFDRLRLSDVPGTPRLGPAAADDPEGEAADAAGDWFRQVVRAMFGGYDPVTRQRFLRELFLLVPKKNSKTTYGALGLMLTALLLNERPRAPFLMTAPVQDTADLAFSAVAGAIQLDPVLDRLLHVRDHLKEIVHRNTKAKLEIITFDPAQVTGRKVAGALIDEVHVLGKMPRAEKALLQLRGGMQPFPEAFLAMITTQSDDTPAGVFRDELLKARAIRDGTRKGAMLPVLYEFPEAMQRDPAKPWLDPENWAAITPNLGRSIDLSRLVEECRDESGKGERSLRIWASQHLNIEIGLALHADRWPGANFWERQGRADLADLVALLERCEVATVGVDAGGLDDMLAVAVIGRERESGHWLAWSRAWAHRSVLELRKSEASRLEDFERQGDLVLVENIGEDTEELAGIVALVNDSGLLARQEGKHQGAIGCDPALIGAVVDALLDAGMTMEQIVAVSQGWRLAGAINTVERKLAGGEFFHGARPLMAWCVGNAKVEPRANSKLITKQASGTAKIDPLMALFNAAHLMSLNPEAGGGITVDDSIAFVN